MYCTKPESDYLQLWEYSNSHVIYTDDAPVSWETVRNIVLWGVRNGNNQHTEITACKQKCEVRQPSLDANTLHLVT